MSSAPPPAWPPNQPRRNTAKVIVAIIVVVIFIGALGTYLFVLAPKLTIVDWSHQDLPNLAAQYVFNVTVKNSGKLTGTTTIVCEFSYYNGTGTRAFNGTKDVELGGGAQGQYDVPVTLPAFDAILSILSTNKSWNVHLD